MLRSIAVLVPALATATAYAQDAGVSKGEEPAAQLAPAPAGEGERPQAVLASTTPMESQSSPLPANAPASQPAPAMDPPAPTRAAAPPIDDCSVVEALLSDAALAIRVYEAPRLPLMKDSWKEPPRVWRATRCADKYVIQVRSRSVKPWVLRDARLDGPNDMVLEVLGVRPSLLGEWSINVIVAEAPQGAGADFPLLRLHLVGEDGRVAALGGVVLP